MYATCLQCARTLGRNELVECFPVGRRLAYDLAGGRLWVVCVGCGAWNLAPFEERWAGMEEAERRYRATRTRVATGEIGLARLRDGKGAVDLVRIGRPLRPEFAAWRYGERFVRRHRLAKISIGAAFVGGFANLVLSPLVGGLAGAVVMVAGYGTQWAIDRPHRNVRVLLPGSAEPVKLSADHLQRIKLVPRGERFSLRLSHPSRERPGTHESTVELDGDDALRAGRVVLPALNVAGGNRRNVDEAVRLLEDALQDGRDRLTSRLTQHGPLRFMRGNHIVTECDEVRWLSYVPLEQRLALEMALNEDVERRALEGELALLEAAWRDAEAVARIADSLAVPEAVERRVTELGRRERS